MITEKKGDQTTDSDEAPIEEFTEEPFTPDEDGIPNAG